MAAKNMEVSIFQYDQLMHYIERDVSEIKEQVRKLRQNPEERRDLQLEKDLVDRQHKLFRQWYVMNENLKSEGQSFYTGKKIAEIGSQLLDVTRHADVLQEGRGSADK